MGLRYPKAPRLLARNVWQLREQRRMTARTLAEKLNWSMTNIYKIENGDKLDLSLDDLEKIAIVLLAEPAELLAKSSWH